MKHKMYAVYDAAAAAYLPPFLAQNDQVAERMFAAAAIDDSHQFCKHAKDYSLWRIADFDDETAVIEDRHNHCVAQAHEIKARYEAAMKEVPNNE